MNVSLTVAPNANYNSICSDSTGNNLVACANLGGYIYKSTDGGITWNKLSAPLGYWFCVCSDSTGQYLAAVINDGNYLNLSIHGIYTSSDSGITWIKTSAISAGWRTICCSSNGKYLVAGANNGYIYTSSDYGITWSLSNNINTAWMSICSDSTGQYLTAIANYVYTSSNYGTTWTQQSSGLPLGITNYQGICCSSNGQYLSTTANGLLYNSINFGITWIQCTQTIPNSSNALRAIRCDSTGQYLVLNVGGTGPVCISSNYGISWSVSTDIPQYWSGCCINSNATFIACCSAIGLSGSVYTIINPFNLTVGYVGPPTIQPLSFASTVTYGSTPILISNPSSNSSGAFSYTSSDTTVATITGSIMTIVGAGTVTISAMQDAISNYSIGYVTQLITVIPAVAIIQPLTFSNYLYFGSSPFTITDPISNSTGSFSYSSSNTGIASISDSTITINAIGSTVITATQLASANCLTNSTSLTLTVYALNTPIIQPLVFTSPINYGIGSFALTVPSSNSSGAITFSSSNPAVALINGTSVVILSAGVVTITATQTSSGTWVTNSISANLTINKIIPSISALTFTSPITYSINGSFIITNPTSNSGGAITYTSSNTNIATISGTTVNIISAGNVTITALQASTINYTSCSTTNVLTINQIIPTLGALTFTDSVNYGTNPFTIINPTSSSTALFVYTSSNIAVAIINGSTVTIVGSGSTTITATQLSNTNYSSLSVTRLLNIVPRLSTIGSLTFTPSINYLLGDKFILTSPISNSTGTFTYTSSNLLVATISGSTVNTINVGQTTITARQNADTNYSAGTFTTQILTINPINPIIQPLIIANPVKYAFSTIVLTRPISTSNGSFIYTSSNTAVATISGSTVNFISIGQTVITATQNASTIYTSGYVMQDLIISDRNATISNFSLTSVIYGIQPFILPTPTSNSTGSFTYTSSNLLVATISGSTITVLSAGQSTITCIQGADGTYISTPITSVLIVNGCNPTISTLTFIPRTYLLSDRFNLTNPISNSLGLFTYTSDNPSVATISGSSVTIISVGQTTITATQAISGNYGIGTVSSILTVTKATAAISPIVSLITPKGAVTTGSWAYANLPSTLINTPGSTSTGLFTYTSSNTSVAIISGSGTTSTITGVAVGTTTITATQADDNNYFGNSITMVFTIIPNNMALLKQFTTPLFSLPYKYTSQTSVGVSVAFNSSGAITYSTSDITIANMTTSTTFSVGNAGTCLLIATQAPFGIYTQSSSISTIIKITQIAATYGMGFGIAQGTYGAAPVQIIAPASNSGGSFTYTSSDNTIATISGSIATIINAGSVIITAVQAAYGNYSISSIPYTWTIIKIAPTISPLIISTPINYSVGGTFTITPPIKNSNNIGTFVYTSSNTTIVTISGSIVTIVNAGTVTIKATLGTDTNYLGGSFVTMVLVILPIMPTIQPFIITDPIKSYSLGSFVISSAPISGVGGIWSLVKNPGDPITIAGVTNPWNIFFNGIGTCTLTATRAASQNYLVASVSTIITITPVQLVLIYGFTIPSSTYGNGITYITPPESRLSQGTWTYTSKNNAIATISGSNFIPISAGTVTITATQAAFGNYTSGSVNGVLVIQQTPSWGSLSNVTMLNGTSQTIVNPINNSLGTWTYTSSNTAIAKITGSTITALLVGSVIITATQTANANYLAYSTTGTFTIQITPPTIQPLISQNPTYFGIGTYAITQPISNSTGVFVYTSSNTTVATISGANITIKALGNTIITATQSATVNYSGGSYVTQNLVVATSIAPTIQPLLINPVSYGSVPIVLTQPISNSMGTFTYTSSNLAVATISGSTMTILSNGNTTITATQDATTRFLGGSSVLNNLVVVASTVPTIQTLIFTNTVNYGLAPFILTNPISNSSGAFTYTSSNTLVATISGSTVTILSAGQTSIIATQAAAGIYTSSYIMNTLTVNTIAPTIQALTLTSSMSYGLSPFTITDPISTSTGTFIYTSSNPNIVSITGSTITILAVGQITITATQNADFNSNYLSGYFVTKILTIVPILPTIQPFTFVNSINYLSLISFILTNPISNSAGAFTYTSSNPSVASINGKTVTILSAGQTTITGSQIVFGNYSANNVTQVLIINPILPTVQSIAFTPSSIPYLSINSFTIVQPISSSPGTFTYTSSNLSVATISGSTVNIIGGGQTTITATQNATINYISTSSTKILNIMPSIGFTLGSAILNMNTCVYGSIVPTIITQSNANTSAIIYSIISGTAATISNTGILSIIEVGSVIVQISQEASSLYESSISQTEILTIQQAPGFVLPIINLNTYSYPYGSTIPNFSNIVNNNSAEIIYTSSDTNIISIIDTTITIHNVGTATITASQIASTNYIVSTDSVTSITITQIPATMSLIIPVTVFGEQDISIIETTTNSLGQITYSNTNHNIAIVDANSGVVTIINAGDIEVTASQAATQNYEFTQITGTLKIQLEPDILTVFTISDNYFGNSFYLTPPSSNVHSVGKITYSSSSDIIIVDSSSGLVSIIGIGQASITATQAQYGNYAVDTIDNTFNIYKNTIILPTIVLNNYTYTYGDTDPTFSLITNSNPSLIVYTSSNPSVISIVGTTVQINGIGTATITVSQSSSTNYMVSTSSVSQIVTINPITLVLPAITLDTYTYTYGDVNPTFTHITNNNTSSIVYTSSNTRIILIIGTTIQIIGVGTATITASQESSSNYTASTSSTSQIITINPPSGLIIPTIAPFKFDVIVYNSSNFAFNIVDPVSNSIGAFVYTSSDTTIAEVSGNTINVLAVGNVNIIASQAANGIYDSAIVVETLNIINTVQSFSLSILGTYNIANYTPNVIASLTQIIANSFGVPVDYITSLSFTPGSITINIILTFPQNVGQNIISSPLFNSDIPINIFDAIISGIQTNIVSQIVTSNINVGIVNISTQSLTLNNLSLILNGINLNSTNIENLYIQSTSTFVITPIIDYTFSVDQTILTVPLRVELSNSSYILYTTHNSVDYVLFSFILNIPIASCYVEGTEILCIVDNVELYMPIELMKLGTIVKTYKDENKRVVSIGKKTFMNDPFSWYNCMYLLPKAGIHCKDLIVTGTHSILTNELKYSEIFYNCMYYNKCYKKIKDKYLLNAAFSDRFIKQMEIKEYTYYHFVLESDDDMENFGVYANGVLSESICAEYFKINGL
jgi:hypothetical protein